MHNGHDHTARPGRSASTPTAEQERLEQAMRQADDLLINSLQTDERQRVRRRNRWLAFLMLGGLAMVTAAFLVYIGLSSPGQLVALAPAVDQSGQLTREGWELWQKQQYDEAAAKFEAAVKLAPKNTNAWNGLGWSQFNSGNSDEAIKSFEKVIALEPMHPAALNGLGQIAFFRHDFTAAKKYLLKAAPQASAAWYGLAKIYLLEGKYDAAEKWAKKIVASGQADEGAKQMLQAAQNKQLDDELRRTIEPLTADKTSALDDNMRGWKLFQQGRNAEAKEAFAKALEADPEYGAALNGMGWALLNSGEAAEAKPYFEKVIKAEPKAAGAMNGLARVLRAEGDLDGAIKVWEQMLEISSGVNAGTYGLADAYLAKKDYKKAVPLLKQIADANRQDADAQSKLAEAREKAGQ